MWLQEGNWKRKQVYQVCETREMLLKLIILMQKRSFMLINHNPSKMNQRTWQGYTMQLWGHLGYQTLCRIHADSRKVVMICWAAGFEPFVVKLPEVVTFKRGSYFSDLSLHSHLVFNVERTECVFLTLVTNSKYDLNDLWKYQPLFVLGSHIVFLGKLFPLYMVLYFTEISWSAAFETPWLDVSFCSNSAKSRPFRLAVLLKVSRPTQMVPLDWEIMLASSSAYFVWLS